MVARDGGIFSFGDVPFYGSLPSRGVRATNAVGMAPSPSGKGYWIARADGSVYAFGDAQDFGYYTPSPCDPVAGIFANPKVQGYRLLLQSGATVAYFQGAPGGGSGDRYAAPVPAGDRGRTTTDRIHGGESPPCCLRAHRHQPCPPVVALRRRRGPDEVPRAVRPEVRDDDDGSGEHPGSGRERHDEGHGARRSRSHHVRVRVLALIARQWRRRYARPA
jgi:hypothetical protein